MMKIAIFYQKESKLLGDIRKKIRKEACQPDNVYAIYEYSTIKALRKANEQSPMDIVFLEDTIDNCGLTAAKYIRETGQKTSLYFFGKSANRAFYGYEYRTAYYLTEKEQVESLNIYQHFFKKYFPRKTIFLFDQSMDSAWAMCLSEVVYIDLKTGDICTEKGEKKSGYILTEKVLETIRKKTSFLNVSEEYLVNQDFIIDVTGQMIYLYQNKSILCKEKERDTIKEFLWNMGQKELL
ncbi:MAG: hypothetical protein ACLR9C_10180 [Mediterraneibacter gnavus]